MFLYQFAYKLCLFTLKTTKVKDFIVNLKSTIVGIL